MLKVDKMAVLEYLKYERDSKWIDLMEVNLMSENPTQE